MYRRAFPYLAVAAKKAVAAFGPVNDSTEKGCTPKGMPRLMSQPPPMELIDSGSTILLRMEEYDTVRTIHMTAADPGTQLRTPLGYSIGRWDDETLVVETSRVSAPLSQRERRAARSRRALRGALHPDG